METLFWIGISEKAHLHFALFLPLSTPSSQCEEKIRRMTNRCILSHLVPNSSHTSPSERYGGWKESSHACASLIFSVLRIPFHLFSVQFNLRSCSRLSDVIILSHVFFAWVELRSCFPHNRDSPSSESCSNKVI